MEYNVRVRIASGAVVLALVVGLSIITSTLVASRAYEQRARVAAARAESISVRGSARERVVSDFGSWALKVRVEGPTLAEAFAAIEAGAARVNAFLTERAFAPAEVELSPIDTTTYYKHDDRGRETREVAACVLEREFTVASADVAKLAAASGDVTSLLRDGVQVLSSRPNYYFSRLPDLRITLVGDAAKDARARAAEAAAKAGARITELRTLYTGPIQVTRPNSTDVSGGGSYDTHTIDKDVWVSVNATFGVER